MATITSTKSKCRSCKTGTIVQEVTVEFPQPRGELVMGRQFHLLNSSRNKTELYCDTCGVMYKHLPKEAKVFHLPKKKRHRDS